MTWVKIIIIIEIFTSFSHLVGNTGIAYVIQFVLPQLLAPINQQQQPAGFVETLFPQLV